MASRMDRYNDNKEEVNDNSLKRTKRNANLYRSVYNDSSYSNIENIETLEKTNVINVDQVKQMLNKDKLYAKSRSLKEDMEEINDNYRDDDKSYDINDILHKAKEEETKDTKLRSIENLRYEYERKNKEPKDEQEEVDELIHTIFTNSLTENNDDLLQELKSNTMIGDNTAIADNVKEEERRDTEIIDNTFYTSSMKLNKKDFIGDKGEEKESSNVFIKTSIAILIVAFLVLLVYIIFFLK